MDSSGNIHCRLEELLPMMEETLARGQRIRLSPNGTSMLPLLRQGRDSVTLSPLPEKLKKFDIVLYKRENGQFVLHRIIKTGETYTCLGDNQFVSEPGLGRGQMIALVTEVCRDGKQVSEGALWLYSRFWLLTRPVRRVLRAVKVRFGRLFR